MKYIRIKKLIEVDLVVRVENDEEISEFAGNVIVDMDDGDESVRQEDVINLDWHTHAHSVEIEEISLAEVSKITGIAEHMFTT